MNDQVKFSWSRPDDNEVELHISIGEHVSVGISFDGYGDSSWYVVSDDGTPQDSGNISVECLMHIVNSLKKQNSE